MYKKNRWFREDFRIRKKDKDKKRFLAMYKQKGIKLNSSQISAA